jgi:hypothetical protein
MACFHHASSIRRTILLAPRIPSFSSDFFGSHPLVLSTAIDYFVFLPAMRPIGYSAASPLLLLVASSNAGAGAAGADDAVIIHLDT